METSQDHEPVFLRPTRSALKRSVVDLSNYFSRSVEDDREPGLTLYRQERHQRHQLTVSKAADLPIGKAMFVDGAVVEKVSDDLLLIGDDQEERVLRISHLGQSTSAGNGLGVSTSFTPDQEDELPLLTRPERQDVLYGGEVVLLTITLPVRLWRSGLVIDTGYLVATNYRVLFVPDTKVSHDASVTRAALMQTLSQKLVLGFASFAHGFVRQVKSKKVTPFAADDSDDDDPVNKFGDMFADSKVQSTVIQVLLVDGRVMSLEIPFTHRVENEHKCAELLRLLRRETPPFAFQFKPSHAYSVDGWNVYNFFTEIRRIFMPAPAILVLDEDLSVSDPVIGALAGRQRPTEWRVFNPEALCTSYPARIVVPRAVTDEQLQEIAIHRSKGRVPALAFLHPVTGAALVRCSQPMAGIKQTRSEEDEFYFQEMTRRNPSGKGMVIYDARPFVNAAWNRGVKGAGYEDEDDYNCKLVFLNIPNVHRVRDSHQALLTQFYDDAPESVELENFLPTARSAEDAAEAWLSTVSKLLDGALRIAAGLKEGVCAAVHCSDGWDRTPQLVSLAMVLSDPFYRTIIGYQLLIESQWVSFGHKFASRSGASSEDYSPVFLQFLDCTWQLLTQHPKEFEFTEEFLCRISREVYACRFGTFLADSLAERAEKFESNTQSLWSDLNSRASVRQIYRRCDNHEAAAPSWASHPGEQKSTEKQEANGELEWVFHPSQLKICRNLHVFWSEDAS